LYLLWYVLEGFVVDLQAISDSPILFCRWRGSKPLKRNGGGRSDVNQILEEKL
jgi:hypothetical protein